jgi:hypothetical protein
MSFWFCRRVVTVVQWGGFELENYDDSSLTLAAILHCAPGLSFVDIVSVTCVAYRKALSLL